MTFRFIGLIIWLGLIWNLTMWFSKQCGQLHSWFCFTKELPDERKFEMKLFCFHMLFTNNVYTKKYILNHTKQNTVRKSLYKLRDRWNSAIWQWHSSLPVIKNWSNVSDNNNLILSIWKCLFFKTAPENLVGQLQSKMDGQAAWKWRGSAINFYFIFYTATCPRPKQKTASYFLFFEMLIWKSLRRCKIYRQMLTLIRTDTPERSEIQSLIILVNRVHLS